MDRFRRFAEPTEPRTHYFEADAAHWQLLHSGSGKAGGPLTAPGTYAQIGLCVHLAFGDDLVGPGASKSGPIPHMDDLDRVFPRHHACPSELVGVYTLGAAPRQMPEMALERGDQ